MRCGGWFTTTTWFMYASTFWPDQVGSVSPMSVRLDRYLVILSEVLCDRCPGLLYAIRHNNPPGAGDQPSSSSPFSLETLLSQPLGFSASAPSDAPPRRLRFRSRGTGDLSFLFSRSPFPEGPGRSGGKGEKGGCLCRLPQGLFQPCANSSRWVVQLLSPVIGPSALASMAMPALWQGSTASTYACAHMCTKTRRFPRGSLAFNWECFP